MIENNENVLEEQAAEEKSQLDVLDGLAISDLRKFAKLMKVSSNRDWTKEDYVRAIQAKQEQNSSASFVFDPTQAPKPGYARVLVHRDPTPGHKNTPVHFGLNGLILGIPRGVEVDIPYPFIEVMKNAKTVYVEHASDPSRENPSGSYKDEERSSYPYQVLAVTPGEWINPNDARGRGYAMRKAFFDKYGSWPTEGELKEANKARINRDL